MDTKLMKNRWKTRCMLLAAVWLSTVAYDQENAVAEEAQQWSDSVSVGVIDRGWRFEVELFKPITVYLEPIYIRSKITNVSDEARILPVLSFLTRYNRPDIHFEIRNAEGDCFPSTMGHINSARTVDTNVMKKGPGESRVYEFDLLWFSRTGSDECHLVGFPPGEYTANISLYLDPTHRTSRNENTSILPPLRFKIIEPTGDSADAFDLLCRGRTMERQDPDQAARCYDSILTYYSHTPYDERTNIAAISFMARSGGRNRQVARDELVQLRERYFLKYLCTPNSQKNVNELISRTTRHRIRELVKVIQHNPKAAMMLRHLREHHPWIFEGEEGK